MKVTFNIIVIFDGIQVSSTQVEKDIQEGTIVSVDVEIDTKGKNGN